MNKQTLTLGQNYKSPKDVCDLILNMSRDFYLYYGRKESVELVYSQLGDLQNPIHNLAVWFNSYNEHEIKFFQELLP